MSDPTAQEPTMEEILASIRRIISEDDAPAAAAPAPAAVAKPAPEPEPEPAPVVHAAPVHEEEDEDDDVLELHEPAPAPAPEPAPFVRETHGDLDVFDAPAAKPEPEPEPAPVYTPPPPRADPPSFTHAFAEDEDDSLVSNHAASASASHFGSLVQNIGMPPSNQTLDGVVRELLRPLLKDWLDTHLTAIVEQTVQAEVERISRRRVY